MRRHIKATPTVRVATKSDSSLFLRLLMSLAQSAPNQSAPEIELLRTAYEAFNARELDAALAIMTPEVTWPRAFKGGFVHGPEAVRAYWIEQGSEIDARVEPVAFYPEADGRILVDVHQVVRDLEGAVLADEHVGHRFTIKQGLIQGMEICPPPPSGSDA